MLEFHGDVIIKRIILNSYDPLRNAATNFDCDNQTWFEFAAFDFPQLLFRCSILAQHTQQPMSRQIVVDLNVFHG